MHHIPQGCRGRTTIDHQPRYPMLGMERMRRLHVGTYLGFGLEYIVVQQQSLTALDVPAA